MKALPILLTLCLAAPFPSGAFGEARPNVLMVLVDDLNDVPGFMQASPDAQTPYMDRLARSGMVFGKAHCQYPLCGPSRASFMSGLLPSTLNFTSHMKDAQLEARAHELGTPLLHTYFQQHGYKTLAVGKICHNHVPEGSVHASGGRGSFREGTGRLRANWHQENTSTDWAMAPEQDDQLPDYHAAQWAVDRLNEQHDQPFFLMVGFLRPHVPWYVPEPWFRKYPDPAALTLPLYRPNDLEDVSVYAQKISILPQYPRTDWAIEQNQWSQIFHAYLASTSFVDHYVGQVLQALEQSAYSENTIIVLFSDHGYHLGEKNTFQKQTLWERSSRVPLIIAGPTIEPDQRTDRVVSLLDIYPTLVELAGLPPNPANEGRSLLPLLQDPQRVWPYPAITYWEGNNVAIQTEQFRYIRYTDGSEELYDHTTDPHEWNNLVKDPAFDTIKRQLIPAIPENAFTD